MANIILNRLTMEGPQEDIQEVYNWIIDDSFPNQETKYELIRLNRKYIISKYGSLQSDFPCEDNYDWGGNRGALVKSRDNSTVVFATKWMPINDLILDISPFFPSVNFNYEFSDEDYGCNVGCWQIQDGNIISRNMPRPLSDEAYELTLSIWGEKWRNTIIDVQNGAPLSFIWRFSDVLDD